MMDYNLHVTNYVMDHFEHLMTDEEKAAASAVVIFSVEGDQRTTHIGFRDRINKMLGRPAVLREAKAMLQDGGPAFRQRTAQRLLSAHHDEIYANACPRCGRLPATPQARLCFWCHYTWIEA